MRAFCTDLDGTLRHPELGVHPACWEALEELGRRGVVRVVATGRSLFHARKVLPPEAPLDWLVFASGAGWMRWPDGVCQTLPGLPARRAATLAAWLDELGLSYCVNAAAPASHLFHYRAAADDGTDFPRRLERNVALGHPLPPGVPDEALFPDGVSQLLVFAPPGEDWPRRLRQGTAGLRLLHSTSPLDRRSQWIEIQPAGVSKSGAVARLLAALGLGAGDCRAVGNDHNDLDLLEWAGEARVVRDAAPGLLLRFPAVASCAEGGVAEAALSWLASHS